MLAINQLYNRFKLNPPTAAELDEQHREYQSQTHRNARKLIIADVVLIGCAIIGIVIAEPGLIFLFGLFSAAAIATTISEFSTRKTFWRAAVNLVPIDALPDEFLEACGGNENLRIQAAHLKDQQAGRLYQYQIAGAVHDEKNSRRTQQLEELFSQRLPSES